MSRLDSIDLDLDTAKDWVRRASTKVPAADKEGSETVKKLAERIDEVREEFRKKGA